MPKPFDCPLHLIMHAPVLQTATGATYRTTLTLAAALWLGGCRQLPQDDAGQAAIARMSIGAWREQKPAVLAALAEIQPELREAMRTAELRREYKRRAGRSAQAILRARREGHPLGIKPARGDKPATPPQPIRVALAAHGGQPATSSPVSAPSPPNQPATPAPAGRRTRPDFMSEAGLAVPARPQNASQAAPEPAKTAPKPPTHRAQRRQGDGPPIFR
jgi:hypothetical protein